jgi:predicted amidohydrolase YtcJ
LEDQLGSVEVGKAADFIVLDQDLFTMKPDEIWRLQPSLVVMEGKVMQGAYPE